MDNGMNEAAAQSPVYIAVSIRFLRGNSAPDAAVLIPGLVSDPTRQPEGNWHGICPLQHSMNQYIGPRKHILVVDDEPLRPLHRAVIAPGMTAIL